MCPGSSTSTDDPPGFRLGGRLGDRTWRAVQDDLECPVCLRRLRDGDRCDASAWPDRRGVVDLYAVFGWDGATHVATRLIPGARTLDEVGGGRQRRRALESARRTLSGCDLTARDILVSPDGEVHVAGFGRVADPRPADDTRALDRLEGARPRAAWAPWAVGGAGLVALVASAACGAWWAHRDDPPAAATGAPVAAGARAVGSALGPEGVESVDCEGRPASGSSPACTVVLGRAGGREVVAEAPGTVRSWAVRGVRGRVRLQVLAPAGRGF